MAAAPNKTQPTSADVDEFLATIPEPQQQDCRDLAAAMSEATGAPAVMWGSSIVGFGTYHYRGASGHGADWMVLGFSPRKANTTLYLSSGVEPHAGLLATLGPHHTGKGCVYLKRLADIDLDVLRQLLAASSGRQQTSA